MVTERFIATARWAAKVVVAAGGALTPDKRVAEEMTRAGRIARANMTEIGTQRQGKKEEKGKRERKKQEKTSDANARMQRTGEWT